MVFAFQWRPLWLRIPTTDAERLYADYFRTPNSRLLTMQQQFLQVSSKFSYIYCMSCLNCDSLQLDPLPFANACVQLCKNHSVGLYSNPYRFINELRSLESEFHEAITAFHCTVDLRGESSLIPPLILMEDEAILPLPEDDAQIYIHQWDQRKAAEADVIQTWKQQCPNAVNAVMLALANIIKEVRSNMKYIVYVSDSVP
jgi:hypothetical protein